MKKILILVLVLVLQVFGQNIFAQKISEKTEREVSDFSVLFGSGAFLSWDTPVNNPFVIYKDDTKNKLFSVFEPLLSVKWNFLNVQFPKENKLALYAVQKRLEEDDNVLVLIEGFANDIRNKHSSIQIAKGRAEEVQSWLLKENANYKSRLIIPNGEVVRPQKDASSSELKNNRRVDITMLVPKQTDYIAIVQGFESEDEPSKISRERAEDIVTRLKTEGIDSSRITIIASTSIERKAGLDTVARVIIVEKNKKLK